MEELPTGEYGFPWHEIAYTQVSNQEEVDNDYLIALAYVNEYPGEFQKIEEQLQSGHDLTDEQVAHVISKFENKAEQRGKSSSAV